MKVISKTLFIFFASLFLASCTGDDVDAPIITDLEVGVNNSNIGYVGTEFHVEAAVEAAGRIDRIELHIHPENAPGSSWTEELVFEDAQGLKNTEFHKHIEVPTDASVGTYHFHLIVIDEEGQSTEIERDLEIQILVDNVLPVITVTQQPGTSYSNGQTITISGTVTDNIGISGLYIGLVKDSQGLTDADVTHVNTISMLHTHDFEEANDVTFTASLQVGIALDNDTPQKSISWNTGTYYILIKAPNLGGGAAYSVHYPIQINL